MAFAWLEWNGKIYWAKHRRAPFEPRTVLSSLVEGIWQSFPGSAHFILRSRIYTTEPITELCRGTVIVCAKRSTFVPNVPEQIANRMISGEHSIQVWPSEGVCSQNPLSLNSFTTSVSFGPRAEQNRSIECWLISREGRLLATATNRAGRNRIRHAEINLMHLWWMRERRALPSGARLVVTLEPCAMCAGAIWECVSDKSDFEVVYLHADTGSAAARSVLRAHPMLRHCPIISHPFES